MASQLHSRKKPVAHDDRDLEAPSAGQTSRRPQKKRKLLRGTSEVLVATLSIIAFLALGLLLGYFLINHRHRKVILHVMRDPLGHGRGVMRGRQGFRHHFYTGSPRYVTIVMPSVVNQKGRSQRLSSIQDTWGGSARAIYVVHNVSEFPQAAHAVLSDTATPEDHYAYPQLLLLPDEINEEDGVHRLIHTIRTIYKKVDPDFAFFVNDHTYVIPAHLCKYLNGRTPSEDIYEGHALRNAEGEVFNSGAAGYLLSRSAMTKLVERFDSGDPSCLGDKKNTKWIQNNPGLATVKCLNDMGIQATDTRGAQKWHRFHAFPLTRLVSGNIDEWYKKKHVDMDQIAGFSKSYNELLSGEDCCSMDTISFHYVEWRESKAIFAIQEELLEHPHLSDHEVKLLMEQEWPKNHEIGFYSKGLPKESDAEGWKSLIRTIRKISTRDTQRDC